MDDGCLTVSCAEADEAKHATLYRMPALSFTSNFSMTVSLNWLVFGSVTFAAASLVVRAHNRGISSVSLLWSEVWVLMGTFLTAILAALGILSHCSLLDVSSCGRFGGCRLSNPTSLLFGQRLLQLLSAQVAALLLSASPIETEVQTDVNLYSRLQCLQVRSTWSCL
eukprot:s1830_g21.t1